MENISRKPEWLKVKLPGGDNFKEIKENLRSSGPCGIAGNTYSSVESIFQKKLDLEDRELFSNRFEEAIISKLANFKVTNVLDD